MHARRTFLSLTLPYFNTSSTLKKIIIPQNGQCIISVWTKVWERNEWRKYRTKEHTKAIVATQYRDNQPKKNQNGSQIIMLLPIFFVVIVAHENEHVLFEILHLYIIHTHANAHILHYMYWQYICSIGISLISMGIVVSSPSLIISCAISFFCLISKKFWLWMCIGVLQCYIKLFIHRNVLHLVRGIFFIYAKVTRLFNANNSLVFEYVCVIEVSLWTFFHEIFWIRSKDYEKGLFECVCVCLHAIFMENKQLKTLSFLQLDFFCS